MRILLVGGDFREGCQITGYVNAVREISAGLAKGNEVHVVPFLPQRPQLSKDVDWNGVRVISKRLTFILLLGALIGLPRSFRRVMPYLTMYDREGLIGRLKAKLKYVGLYAFNRAFFENELVKYEPEVVHVHGIVIQTLAYHDALLESGHHYLTTAHGLYTHDENAIIDTSKDIEGDVIRALSKKGQMITTVSSKVKEELVKLFDFDPDKVVVVHNGVDTGKFSTGDKQVLRKKHGLPQHRSIILTVGTVGKRKNQAAVLDALNRMAPGERGKVLFISVGGGGVEALRKKISALGLEGSAIFTGKISDGSLADYYALSDFFILTSTSEGFPLVYLEAMAAGLPIVTYADLEAISELYDRECMTLVHERTPEALASGIQYALATDWNRDSIRKKAEGWDWRKVVDEYARVYYLVNK